MRTAAQRERVAFFYATLVRFTDVSGTGLQSGGFFRLATSVPSLLLIALTGAVLIAGSVSASAPTASALTGELIELVAKRLDGDRENTLLTHVQDCAVCRSRLEEIRRTWDILGAWEVLPTGHLDMGKPVPPSDSVRRALAMPILRLRRVGMVLRIAATIAVAVLAGYAAGRWSGNAPSAGESGSPQYVSALGLETGGSLSSLVLSDELPPGGEGWHEAP